MNETNNIKELVRKPYFVFVSWFYLENDKVSWRQGSSARHLVAVLKFKPRSSQKNYLFCSLSVGREERKESNVLVVLVSVLLIN